MCMTKFTLMIKMLAPSNQADPTRAFALPSLNTTPAKKGNDIGDSPSPIDEDNDAPAPTHHPIVTTLESNPIKALAQRSFRPQGALPTGFPKPRDITKDVQGGKIPVKGQNRFSKVDTLNHSHNTP